MNAASGDGGRPTGRGLDMPPIGLLGLRGLRNGWWRTAPSHGECTAVDSRRPPAGPPTDWGELIQAHDDRNVFQGRIDELPVIDIHSL